jgi:type VI secretion system protein ImpE
MNAKQLYDEGRLTDAINTITEEVKKAPTDIAKRAFLAELLCFKNEYERADKQLDFIGHQDAKAIPSILTWRQLCRSAQARDDFYQQGRVPEFVSVPSENTKLQLEASVALRNNDPNTAQSLLAQAEAKRPQRHGECDGVSFDDFRDCDDLLAGCLEIIAGNGNYYWVDLAQVRSLAFQPPERPLDLLWRRGRMVLLDGTEGDIFVPSVYHSGIDNDLARLGRMSDWMGDDNGPIRGVGLRTFLVGEDAKSLLEITQVEFAD